MRRFQTSRLSYLLICSVIYSHHFPSKANNECKKYSTKGIKWKCGLLELLEANNKCWNFEMDVKFGMEFSFKYHFVPQYVKHQHQLLNVFAEKVKSTMYL